MPYIGTQPTTGVFTELDALTASATADYALTLNGAAYNPATVNNLLVSINGVIQAGSTMSLSGNTLTVGATLSSSDVIDFVRVFGSVGTVSTPTDGSVTTAKLGNGSVTAAKLAAGVQGVAGITTASTSGTALSIDSSNRLTMPLQPSFRAIGTTNSFATTSPIPFPSVQHNIGSHFSTSSNEFTVPIAGVYSFHVHIGYIAVQSNAGNGQVDIRVNNTAKAYSYTNLPAATGYIPCSVSLLIELAVNDVVKVQFNANGTASYYGGGVECQFSGYLVG
jgi:hypothetical protein